MDLYVQELHSSTQPSIAILTMPDEKRPFRGNHYNFIDLIRCGKELGAFVYVITVNDVKLWERKIKSYVYNPTTKTWSEIMLPLPDVIYNRIPTRKDELHPEVQQTVQSLLRHSHIRLFNPFFFNKWTLFEWLNKTKQTKRFIPATQRLTSQNDVELFLKHYSTVYLKPVRGKAGKGIMKIEAGSSKTKASYRLIIQNFRKSHISVHTQISKLWGVLKEQIGSEDYIIQQGIKLSSYQNRPFDLRVLVQKNGKGSWSLSGIGARVAGKLSITTHVPRGGSIDEPDKLLSATFGKETARSILLKVKKAAYSIARRIEKASGHTLGEMSMDLGIDTSGQIWFFEANSRPMKFDEPDIRKKSLERIIQYSLYLSKTKKIVSG
ncbi:YheC/YheD family protein [Paenibacillus sp. J2TS4]|uniref:YheC/YheD family endospore coat-associated protein n=1 Tax=Paenibacillus sp. J2TS4 TaxID=2807194 RepID=UPI001B039FB2|nr:YheC/YheD family protein [Paenibacillus sp. J2TS4]GIP33687.1 endospore coat-associated protein YheD [Paenibacillus sp. J2TS4]